MNELHGINASNFEVLTVCALLVFERAKVDIVLLEVGMGGRLDATNIVPDECILVSVITSIDLDHQAFLGPTTEAIAREKAGIIRNGKPIVIAPQAHDCVYSVISDVAKQKNAPLIRARVAKERDWYEKIDGEKLPSFSLHPFVPPPPRPVEVECSEQSSESERRDDLERSCHNPTKYRVLLPLHGPHQLGNLGAALTALHILRFLSGSISSASGSASVPSDFANVYKRVSLMDEADVRSAVRDCTWLGRLSFHLYRDPVSNEKGMAGGANDGGPTRKPALVVLVDGAHNEGAARTLSEYVSSLLCCLADSNMVRRKKRHILLTMILALSHSPPKTPASVLVPLLSPFLEVAEDSHTLSRYRKAIHLTTRIGLVRFSPPEGMPWVRPVLPSVTREVVRSSFPEFKDSDFWVASDKDSDALQDLQDALHWASGGQCAMKDNVGEEEDENDEENLVVVAGSLYLVADFYRCLQGQ